MVKGGNTIYEAVYACLFAGFVATITLATFSCLGRRINARRFSSFGSWLVAIIAMRIAGLVVPELSDPIMIQGVKLTDRLGLISFAILAIGIVVSIQRRAKCKEETGKDKASGYDLSVRSLFFLMVFLLILPSIDGNIITLSATGQLDFFGNMLFTLTVALTIISGAGSWALAVQLGVIVGRKKGIAYTVVAGIVGTVSAVIATLVGQLLPPSALVGAPVAAVAILVSSIIIHYGIRPKGGISSVPPAVVAFACIIFVPLSNDAVSVISVVFIAVFSIFLVHRLHRNLLASTGFAAFLMIEFLGYAFGIYQLLTALQLAMLTHGSYFLVALVDFWGAMIERFAEAKHDV